MKNKIYSLIRKIEFKIENGKQLKGKKRVFLACVQTHGNLGDQAITVASENFIKKYMPDYEIVELNTSNILDDSIISRISFSSDDILIIQGGGFLGNLWEDIYCATIKIIKLFKNNKIIIFPQSYSYTRDEIGDSKAQEDLQLFKECNNLHLFVRDKISYDLFKKYFKGYSNIYLCPDIVYSLEVDKKKNSNSKLLLMIRNDREGKTNVNELINTLKCEKINFEISDTIVSGRINKNNRLKKIFKKLHEIKSYELVITDRLHGMIFSYITNTPCLVLSNNNHKVKGAYLWISKSKNVLFIDNIEKLMYSINKLKRIKNNSIIDLNNEYKELIKIVKE